MDEFWRGLGIGAMLLCICLGIGSCAYLANAGMAKRTAAEHCRQAQP